MSDLDSSEYLEREPEEYEKYEPGLDSDSAIKETEKYIRNLLKDVPPAAWEDLEEPCRKWSSDQYRMRHFLFKEIFQNMVADETTKRIKAGEMVIKDTLPPEDDDDDAMPLISWTDVAKMKFPENPWRINKVLPLAGIKILAAASTGRKTWIAMEMANAITTPRPFLHDNFFETKGCNVLYIDAEMGLPQFQRRGTQLGFDEVRKYKIHTLGDNISLNFYSPDCDDLERITESIKRNDIGVVIIDTFRAVAGGLKEEKAEEVRALFNRLKTLKDMGVSVVILDHLRKKQQFEGKKPNMDQLFSSQDKAASADMINMLRADDPSNTIMFYQVKNRYGQVTKPFRIKMTDTAPDEEHNRIALKFDEWEQEDEKLLEQAKEAVIALLENGEMKRQDILVATKKMKLGSERTISRACTSLEETGLITKTKIGKEVSYSLKTPEKEEDEEENEDKSLF